MQSKMTYGMSYFNIGAPPSKSKKF